MSKLSCQGSSFSTGTSCGLESIASSPSAFSEPHLAIPLEIRTLFWQVQQLAGLQREIRQLKQELERRTAEIDVLEIKADFYRRQVALESRFGLMLERTFA